MQVYEYELQKAQELNTKRPAWSTWAGDAIGKALGVISTFFIVLFVLVALIVGTFVLLIAEFIAVYEGFAVMDADRAALYALAIILFYVVVLFIQEMVIDRNGYMPSKRLSLRLILADLAYFLGIGKQWQAQYNALPDARQRIEITIKFVTYTIVVFGVLGRLADKLGELKESTWLEAIPKLFFESSLDEMIGYLGIGLATLALLWSLKWIVTFIYDNFRKVTGGVTMQDFSQASFIEISPVKMKEAHQKQLMQRELLRLEAKNKSKG